LPSCARHASKQYPCCRRALIVNSRPSSVALPGSPKIQNLIPTNFLGTNAYLRPWLGLFVSICMAGSGMMWKNYRINKR
jgi:hypothetical protein